MYMSYCRFEGTFAELRACLCEVEEHVNEEAESEVSDREINHFREMVKYFYDFLMNQELIDEEGDLDESHLEEITEAMAKRYDTEEEDY